MELLEGLKYGAIGLCVIMFIFSTRLLLKEQNREGEARVPILNMIKMFLGAAVFLSLFFGLSEVFKPKRIDKDIESSINRIWEENYFNSIDTTLQLKLNRIKSKAQNIDVFIDTSTVCEDVITKLNHCETNLKEIDHQFYSNIVKLKKEIDKNGESINIDWDKANKRNIYKIIEDIFIKLDELNAINNSDEVIRAKWKEYKKKWSKKDHKYVLYSDVPQLVRQYLNKFYPSKNRLR